MVVVSNLMVEVIEASSLLRYFMWGHAWRVLKIHYWAFTFTDLMFALKIRNGREEMKCCPTDMVYYNLSLG